MIKLPYPVSSNLYWRNFQGRMVRSSKADSYKKAAAIATRYAGVLAPLDGDVEVVIEFHPRQNKDGSASKSRLDLDNVIKVTLDSLNGLTYRDDRQVVRLSVELAGPIKDGGLSVWVSPVAEVIL